jgi:tRNA threonylcarbamoyladenosine biosynthesis protein TsaB
MRHSAEIFPCINELLEANGKKASDIGYVYISKGPGSFTGLRIAVTAAKMMNLSLGCRIVGVDTLDCIAENAIDYFEEQGTKAGMFATILDAKRGDFFVAVYEYENGGWKKVQGDSLLTAEAFVEKYAKGDEPIWLLGEGLVYCSGKFECAGTRFMDESYWPPKAEKVLKLGMEKAKQGEFDNPLELGPMYLQRPDVKVG